MVSVYLLSQRSYTYCYLDPRITHLPDSSLCACFVLVWPSMSRIVMSTTLEPIRPVFGAEESPAVPENPIPAVVADTPVTAPAAPVQPQEIPDGNDMTPDIVNRLEAIEQLLKSVIRLDATVTAVSISIARVVGEPYCIQKFNSDTVKTPTAAAKALLQLSAVNCSVAHQNVSRVACDMVEVPPAVTTPGTDTE